MNELRTLAAAATPGPWWHDESVLAVIPGKRPADDDLGPIAAEVALINPFQSAGHDQQRADGDYIAAASPDRIIALLDAAVDLLIAVDNAGLEALVDAKDGAEEPDWQTRLWDAADAARAVITSPVITGADR